MHLPDRDKAIDQLSASIGKLTSRHADELRRLLGSPPDPSKVPPSFWMEAREEMEREIAAALVLLFLAAADVHGGDIDALEAAATIHATQRAQAQATSYANAVKARMDKLAEGFPGAPASAGDGPSRQDFASGPNAQPAAREGDAVEERTIDADKFYADLEGTFEAQGERIAATEATNAETAGGDAAIIDQFGDVSQDDIWRAHPSRTKSGSCGRCLRLDGTRRKKWGEIDPDAAGGPTLHEHCACTIDYAMPAQPQPA